MKFSHLLRMVGDGPVFETGLLLAGDVEPAGVRRELSHWTRKGQLYQFLLNHALQQTGWDREPLAGEDWRRIVRHRLETVDWGQVVADVRPFLDPAGDPGLLTEENVMRVLAQGGGGGEPGA